VSTHLFLALSTKGFGETLLGLQIARALADRGDDAAFLIHESSATILKSTPFEFMTLSEHAGPLLPTFVSAMVDEHAPASIVLADFFTTDLWLDHHGLTRDFLKPLGVPLVAIDTWCIEKTGTEIDIYWQKARKFEDWTHELDLVIQPVPLVPHHAGRQVYSCLPSPCDTGAGVRECLRARLGLSPDDKIVLFCTAAWQQTKYSCEEAQRLAATVPLLLTRYFSRLADDVHLLHVGPQRYETVLDRYHWMSQVEPAEFTKVVGGADLLLTANISSTTIAKAIVSGVPVLAVINSFQCATPDDLDRLPFALDDEDARPWLLENVPLYRYYMWPVGYYSFLQPLLSGSKYLQAVPTVELLDRQSVIAGIEALVQPSIWRTEALQRQAAYVAEVRGLPNPADLVMQATYEAG
jgi:hypothetical protein